MNITFKIPTSDQVIFWGYLVFLFFLPFTKISLPATGKLEFTFSDAVLVFIGAIVLSKGYKIKRNFFVYIGTFLFFFTGLLINAPLCINYISFFRSILPYFFSFTLILTTLMIMSRGDIKNKFNYIWFIIFISLALSAIPVYFQIFTGVKNILFYDKYGWRYTFLAQNPNQFGVYLILFLFLLTLITQRFYRYRLKYVILLQVIYFAPVMFSGSRTAMFAASLNFLVLLGLFFFNLGKFQKAIFLPLAFLAITSLTPVILNLVAGQGGQINRALKVFETIDKKGTKVIGDNSPSGRSMVEGKKLFMEHPILGIGLGQKRFYSNYVTEVHNTYLKIAAESGIVGFFGFCLIFALPLVSFISAQQIDLKSKLIICIFYGIFMLMNYPHMLLRQRWVWFFMVLCFILSKTRVDGTMDRSYLKFLN